MDEGGSLSVLSAMFTPVVLINACGLFILSTAQRLARLIERVRKMGDLAETLQAAEGDRAKARRLLVADQLGRTARRAHMMQRSLAAQYVSICLFVATVFAIAAVQFLGGRGAWAPLMLALAGVLALLYACVMLILESREAFDSIRRETEFALKTGRAASPGA